MKRAVKVSLVQLTIRWLGRTVRDAIRQEKQQTNKRLDGSRDILRIRGMNQAGVGGDGGWWFVT